jgi:hypothetical protein
LKLALVALFSLTLQCTYETLLAIVEMKGFTYLVVLVLAAGVSAGGPGRFFRKRQDDDCQSGIHSPHFPRLSFGLQGLTGVVTVEAQGTWQAHSRGVGTVTVTLDGVSASSTATVTITEDIFVACSVHHGKTECTPLSTVTVAASEASPTGDGDHQHGKKKGAKSSAVPAVSSRHHRHAPPPAEPTAECGCQDGESPS